MQYFFLLLKLLDYAQGRGSQSQKNVTTKIYTHEIN